jgi:hypothetical protein
MWDAPTMRGSQLFHNAHERMTRVNPIASTNASTTTAAVTGQGEVSQQKMLVKQTQRDCLLFRPAFIVLLVMMGQVDVARRSCDVNKAWWEGRSNDQKLTRSIDHNMSHPSLLADIE